MEGGQAKSSRIAAAKVSHVDRLITGLAAVLLLPAIVLAGSDGVRFQAGFLDPFVYYGYVTNFPELIARYGQTYYSARISYIFVERGFAWLFGAEAGYVLLRYVCFVAGAGVLWAIARRQAGPAVALFVVVWFACVPWFLRSIAWTHYDGVAVTYLLLFLGLLMLPRQGLASHFAAGVLVGLATNANMFLIGMAGLFAPSWLILNHGHRAQRLLVWAAAALCGFAATYASLNLAYASYFPGGSGPFIEAASLQWTGQVMAGGSSQWLVPMAEVLGTMRLAAFFPLAFLLLLGAILLRKGRGALRGDRFTLAALAYGTAVVLLFVVMHFVVRTGVIGLFYYTIYLLPASALLLIAIGRHLSFDSRAAQLSLLVTAAVVFLVWLVQPIAGIRPGAGPATLWFGLFLLGFAALLAPRLPALAAVGLIGPWLLSLSLYAYPGGVYNIRSAEAETHAALNRDLAEAGRMLHAIVNPLAPPRERLDFWYPNSALMRLDSIQSTYLWGFSRIAPCCRPEEGLPHVTQALREALGRGSILVLVAETDELLAAGTEALRAADQAFDILRDASFDGHAFRMRIRVVRLRKA